MNLENCVVHSINTIGNTKRDSSEWQIPALILDMPRVFRVNSQKLGQALPCHLAIANSALHLVTRDSGKNDHLSEQSVKQNAFSADVCSHYIYGRGKILTHFSPAVYSTSF